MEKLVDLSYDDLKKYTKNIFDQMIKDNFYPNAIVIPLRGGLFLSQEILYFDENDGKDVDVFIINLKTYKGFDRLDEPILKQDFDFKKLLKYDKVLIVDDICDSGTTLQYIKDKLDHVNIKTAVLVDKTKTCDYYGEIFQSDDWIKFPWDN